MSYDASFSRLGLHAIFDLQGAQDDLADWCGATLPGFPPRPNSLTRDGARLLGHVGPGHWLLLDALSNEDALTEALKPDHAPPHLSIVRVSDLYALFEISGPDAPQILSIASPLDLRPKVFAEDGCTGTEFFTLKAYIWRHAHGFQVAVERSFADMVEDYLLRAQARPEV